MLYVSQKNAKIIAEYRFTHLKLKIKTCVHLVSALIHHEERK